MTLFKAYDVRGEYPKELNDEVAYRIGRAFATFLGKKTTVAVGGDSRLSTPSLKKKFIQGLLDSGIDVVDVGLTPTPVMYFCGYKLGFEAAVEITGSHLTKEYNGIKFCGRGGISISYSEGLNKVEEILKNENFVKGKGIWKRRGVVPQYVEYMKSLGIDFSGIKVVIDGANGAAGKIYAQVLRECRAEVVEIFCEPDGNFPNHTPDPMNKEFIKDLERKVKEEKADIGMAFDGDGDRLNIVDNTGTIANSNHIFSLLAKDVLKGNPSGKIVHDVLCSKLVDDVINSCGGIPITSKVGHSIIAKRCLDENAVMAGEVSGHYFFKEANYTDDVLVACIKILKIIKENNKPLSELTNMFPKFFEYSDRLPIREDRKFEFIENLKEQLANKGHDTLTLDGVRVNFENGWMLFRPSNTEPKISFGYESSDREEFEKIKSIAEEIVKTIPQ